MDDPQRIVCIHLNQIGDLLFSLPALYNLRKRFPNVHISSIVRPGCAELLARTGLVDDVIPRPKRGNVSDAKLAFGLRKDMCDLLVLFSTSPAAWGMAQLSGARVKAGFIDFMNGFLLDIVSPWSSPPSTVNNLRLIELVGCDIIKRDYVGLLKTTEADRKESQRILCDSGIVENQKYVVLSAGTSEGRETKCWTFQGFAGIADRLMDGFGLKSVIVGVGGGQSISSLTQNAVDLTGKTSLPVLAAVLEQSSVFIGIDSGVMHLAAAMGVPVVGLFGPTDPTLTGPQGDRHAIVRVALECSPCLKSDCHDPMCMTGITVDDVYRVASMMTEVKNGNS